LGTAIKHPVPDQIKPSFVIFDIRALGRSLMAERQSVRMSKITHDSLSRSDTCFHSCTHMATFSGRQMVKLHYV